MTNYKNILRELIIETIKEETQYQRFFKSALKKFGVSSPDEFDSEERKKEFFDYVDNNWKADNEGSETQYQKFFKSALDKFGVSSPDEFESEEKKKEFFDYVDANWKADDEPSESITEDSEYQKIFKKVLGMFGVESPDDLEKEKKAKFFAYMDAIWDEENSKLRDEPSKQDVDALTEFHRSRLSEGTINEGNAKDFKKFILQSLNKNPDADKIKQAIEWFAGSVYGDTLPNNLHRDDIKGKHIKAVIKKIEDEMKDDPDWYGPKVMNAFLKQTGLSGAKRIMATVKESMNETHWINPQSKQKLARKMKTKGNQLKFSGFPSGDKTPSSKIISGKVELPNGETYKVDVDWKKGEIVDYVKESLNEKIEDFSRGDLVHVTKDNKSGVVIKQYGQKVHIKFANGDTKTYNSKDIRKINDESINEVKQHGPKIEALNDFFNGRITAKELKDMADNVFGRPVATKKELQDFINNKFLQGVMADTYDISPSQLEKKVKELLKVRVYEGIVLEREVPIEKIKVGDTVTNPTGGNKRTNPPIFTVDKIEKRKGSRGQEIILRGTDRFGKKQALIRDKGKPVQIEESIELVENRDSK